jgi:hypothetical protein
VVIGPQTAVKGKAMMQGTNPTKMVKQTPRHTINQDRALQDGELSVVTGGALLQNTFSNVLKSIGEGLKTMASKA